MKKTVAIMVLSVSIFVYAGVRENGAGLIFNEDSSNFLHTRPTEKMTVEGLQKHVDLRLPWRIR